VSARQARHSQEIEVQRVRGEDSKSPGDVYWAEDRPAYPASLAQACEMLCERIAKESDGDTPDGLVDAMRNAATEVRRYMEMARNAA